MTNETTNPSPDSDRIREILARLILDPSSEPTLELADKAAERAYTMGQALQALEAIVNAARIHENQRLVDSIDENLADRYPKIIENDSLTYVSHGHALACKQFKRNAKVRIAALQHPEGRGMDA